MKTTKLSFAFLIVALIASSCGTSQGYLYSQGYGDYGYYEDDYGYYEDGYGYQRGGISFNVFYNELRPYGRWINDRSYGNIWVPNVGRDFHPSVAYG